MVVLAIATIMMQFGRKKKKPELKLEVEKKPKKKSPHHRCNLAEN